MMKRALLTLLLALGLGTGLAGSAQAQDYYHYPYYYFPHNYAPLHYRWPDPRQTFQPPPPYMYYPPYRNPTWRYDMWEHQKYYRGNHFFLDQF